VRTDEVCDNHHLNFVRLVRKGSRPWNIGCPLCHHINSNAESLAEIPSMNKELAQKILAKHIYTVAEPAHCDPAILAERLDLPMETAQNLTKVPLILFPVICRMRDWFVLRRTHQKRNGFKRLHFFFCFEHSRYYQNISRFPHGIRPSCDKLNWMGAVP
jgi:DNA topoisomerase I